MRSLGICSIELVLVDNKNPTTVGSFIIHIFMTKPHFKIEEQDTIYITLRHTWVIQKVKIQTQQNF
jgi:hypothetical protein